MKPQCRLLDEKEELEYLLIVNKGKAAWLATE
jgi:hypothetical protein